MGGEGSALSSNVSDSIQEMAKTRHYVPVKDFLKGLSVKHEEIIVDIRPQKDFETVHIPDSLNIPLFALKTKSFLKDKNVFLINKGYDYEALEDECTNLIKNGYNIMIILGGLNSWKDEGGSLEGSPSAIEAINKVQALEVYQQAGHQDVLLINLSPNKSKFDDALTSKSISVPYINEKSFPVKLTECLKNNQRKNIEPLLFISEHGENYDKVHQIIKTMGIKNVFYLEGGLDAYKKFLNEKFLMSKTEKITSNNNKCGTCP